MLTSIKVPASLLLEPTLPASAKVLWMLLSLQSARAAAVACSQRCLAAEGHLARKTVRAGLKRLAVAGWAQPGARGEWVTIDRDHATRRYARVPAKLLAAGGVSHQARVLYGGLQLTPGFNAESGQCTHQLLSRLTGRAAATMRRAVRVLVATGWLNIEQTNMHAPIEFTLTDPDREREDREVADAERLLDAADYIGEAIMYAFLNLLVASDDYQDHARPAFLLNPFTRMLMELDRFYAPARVAFEFNGPQHYGTTDQYPDDPKHKRQQARDDMKRGMCERQGIRLAIVRAKDLTLERMRRKVDGLLPLRNLARHQRLSVFLQLVSSRYRRKAEQNC